MSLSRRQAVGAIGAACLLPGTVHAAPDKARIAATMMRATRFMVEKASVRGGYVWAALPDLSRRWGELEAFPQMIWVQPPGTPSMGHIFLDAYAATGDAYYYDAARRAALALVAGQTAEGGWHYFIDFAGPKSRARWYATIGRNAWRLEEFQHDWGNATFDDAATSLAAEFLLRFWSLKRDKAVKPALDKAIGFVLASQHSSGGWPQRWPVRNPFVKRGHADYTGDITFNDDVIGGNVDFLLHCHQVFGDPRMLAAVRKAMDVYLLLQQPAPQAGWGLQYDPDTLKPVGARTYELPALVTHATAGNVRQLMKFYRWTGERRFLDAVPPALDWLASTRLADPSVSEGRGEFPTFVSIGTNKPLFVHRRGSNVVNGAYYVDDNPRDTVRHYSSFRNIDLAALRKEAGALGAADAGEVTRQSPLRVPVGTPLPAYYVAGGDEDRGRPSDAATEVIGELNAAGWWPGSIWMSHPYAGDGPTAIPPGDFRATFVGDASDTSEYPPQPPVNGISTQTFINNMATLIRAHGAG